MKQSGFVVVNEAARKNAGLVTWWTLSGSVSVARLRAAWIAAGNDPAELPELPGPQVLLRRALMQYISDRRHTLLRPLPDGEFAVVRERVVAADDGHDVEYETLFKAWIDSDCVVTDGSGEVDDAVDILFERAKQTYESHELSSWFVRRVEAAQAVGLRDRGGIYFVPETAVEGWSAFAALVSGLSQAKIYEIPAMRTQSAVAAVLDAVQREAAQAAEALAQELAAGNLGAKALQGRVGRVEALARKVASYEALLGVQLGELQQRLVELNAKAVEAILVAEAA